MQIQQLIAHDHKGIYNILIMVTKCSIVQLSWSQRGTIHVLNGYCKLQQKHKNVYFCFLVWGSSSSSFCSVPENITSILFIIVQDHDMFSVPFTWADFVISLFCLSNFQILYYGIIYFCLYNYLPCLCTGCHISSLYYQWQFLYNLVILISQNNHKTIIYI